MPAPRERSASASRSCYRRRRMSPLTATATERADVQGGAPARATGRTLPNVLDGRHSRACRRDRDGPPARQTDGPTARPLGLHGARRRWACRVSYKRQVAGSTNAGVEPAAVRLIEGTHQTRGLPFLPARRWIRGGGNEVTPHRWDRPPGSAASRQASIAAWASSRESITVCFLTRRCARLLCSSIIVCG